MIALNSCIAPSSSLLAANRSPIETKLGLEVPREKGSGSSEEQGTVKAKYVPIKTMPNFRPMRPTPLLVIDAMPRPDHGELCNSPQTPYRRLSFLLRLPLGRWYLYLEGADRIQSQYRTCCCKKPATQYLPLGNNAQLNNAGGSKLYLNCKGTTTSFRFGLLPAD